MDVLSSVYGALSLIYGDVAVQTSEYHDSHKVCISAVIPDPIPPRDMQALRIWVRYVVECEGDCVATRIDISSHKVTVHCYLKQTRPTRKVWRIGDPPRKTVTEECQPSSSGSTKLDSAQ